ncbi:MAG: glutamine-hydrolyzing GMP synthase [Armatimonadota bacterium]
MDTIAVVDFGGQYAHLIANRIRRLGVYSEIILPSSDPSVLAGLKGIILSGGPSSVYEPDAPRMNNSVLAAGVPILGLCYGHQLLAQMLGGTVEPGAVREYGVARLKVLRPEGPLAGLGPVEDVWMSHGDVVSALPPGFVRIGETSDCPTAAVADFDKRIFGLQFHPEVTHTTNGVRMLDNFLNLCQCRRDWTTSGFIEDTIRRIREQVGDRNVFLLVSGGIDSAVAFALLNRALGKDRVLGLHVDTGFMRKDETRLVMQALKDLGFDNCLLVDASERFLSAVQGVTDPQEKRAIVGRVFVDVRDDELDRLNLDPDHWMLGQGTLYPDVIESGGSKHAAVIKTHHNRVDVIEELIARGMVVEPLAQLYKDEVRQVAEQLGLPRELIWRHPFPGPGLSVRCLCSAGDEQVSQETLDHAKEVASRFGLQATVLPVRSVGVQGDERTYAHPAALAGDADWKLLETASTALTNEVRDINRVVYLLRPQSIPPLRPKPAYLTRERLDILREADAAAMDELSKLDLMDKVFQMPVVLVPLTTDGTDECVVLRPLESQDVMTARFAELPLDTARRMAERVASTGPIAAVFYDVTHKPPATMEWE